CLRRSTPCFPTASTSRRFGAAGSRSGTNGCRNRGTSSPTPLTSNAMARNLTLEPELVGSSFGCRSKHEPRRSTVMKASRTPQNDALQSLRDVSEAIRQRRFSPVDVVTTCLDRIGRLQPRLNAFITVTADAALHAAKVAEEDIAVGRWKGPLHGIPVGIKDFYDTAGLRTTAAFERFRDRIPKKDAVAVEKLKRAGAIVIGKTNMHKLGAGTTGLDSFFGPAINPWNANYIPGGSSSGSAVAVASGLCYATLDTDAIRSPPP